VAVTAGVIALAVALADQPTELLREAAGGFAAAQFAQTIVSGLRLLDVSASDETVQGDRTSSAEMARKRTSDLESGIAYRL
jgi:hypothetical protein